VAVGGRAGGGDWKIVANASRNAATLLPRGSVQRANSEHQSGEWFAPCALDGGGASLYIVYVYAVDARPVIADFRDARQIMNRFSGVPTAKIAGYYGREDCAGGADTACDEQDGGATRGAAASGVNGSGWLGAGLALDPEQLDGIDGRPGGGRVG
jgi:hypothetical protein